MLRLHFYHLETCRPSKQSLSAILATHEKGYAIINYEYFTERL